MNSSKKNRDSEDNVDNLDDVGRTSRRVHLDGAGGFEVLNEDQDGSHRIKKPKKKKKKKKKKRKSLNQRRRMASPGEEVPPDEGGYEPGTPYDGPPPGEETDFEDKVTDPEDEGHGAPGDAFGSDEDDIEVDVVEGESRVAKRGTFKREANSFTN